MAKTHRATIAALALAALVIGLTVLSPDGRNSQTESLEPHEGDRPSQAGHANQDQVAVHPSRQPASAASPPAATPIEGEAPDNPTTERAASLAISERPLRPIRVPVEAMGLSYETEAQRLEILRGYFPTHRNKIDSIRLQALWIPDELQAQIDSCDPLQREVIETASAAQATQVELQLPRIEAMIESSFRTYYGGLQFPWQMQEGEQLFPRRVEHSAFYLRRMVAIGDWVADLSFASADFPELDSAVTALMHLRHERDLLIQLTLEP